MPGIAIIVAGLYALAGVVAIVEDLGGEVEADGEPVAKVGPVLSLVVGEGAAGVK